MTTPFSKKEGDLISMTGSPAGTLTKGGVHMDCHVDMTTGVHYLNAENSETELMCVDIEIQQKQTKQILKL